MRLTNKILITVFLVNLFLVLVFFCLHYLNPTSTGENDNLYVWLIEGLNVVSVLILILNGTLRKTIFFRIILLLSILVFLPRLEIVSNHNMEVIAALIGIFVIPFVYAISFFAKKSKNALDRMKLTWVVIIFAGSILKVMHLPGADEIIFVGDLYLVAMVIYFLFRYHWPVHRAQSATGENRHT